MRRPRRRKPPSKLWKWMTGRCRLLAILLSKLFRNLPLEKWQWIAWILTAFLLLRLLQHSPTLLQPSADRPTVEPVSAVSHRLASSPANFENAVQAVREIAQQSDPNNQAHEGITQTQYDRWRQAQGQPLQPIANLQPAEVEAIHQTYWQQGGCGSYAIPLDIACLDTVLAFGVDDGRSFFAGLPANPQQAANEVARRRLAYRERQQNASAFRGTPYPGESSFDPETLTLGTARDRALQARLSQEQTGQNQARQNVPADRVRIARRQPDYSPDQTYSSDLPQADRQPSSNLRENVPDRPSPPNTNSDSSLWARMTAPLRSLLNTRDANPPAELDVNTLYTNAKPFTVELWIHINGGYAPATGIILRSDGLILTNYHVIANNPAPSVHLADGRKFTGQVLTGDASIDLALVKIEGTDGLPTAKLANSTKDIQAGDTVYAIGSPMGAHWKLTEAQVMRTDSLCGSRALDNQCIRTPTGFLYPGNSGGPLLNTRGEVIGVNRAIQESTGQGVSIPIEIVQQFLARSRQGF